MAPQGPSRRNFLKAAGMLGFAASLASCLKRRDPYALPVDKPPVPGSDKWYRGEEKSIATVCGMCPVQCGIMVRVVEGRAVKIDGNPNSLLSNGRLGPKGQVGHFSLYDPDRIQGPLKRDGERGSGRWKPITWEEAIGEVSTRLGALRSASQPHKLAVFCGRPRGFMKDLLERFCRSYGSPNFFDPRSTSDAPLIAAMGMSMGKREIPAYDTGKAVYILSLGSGMAESDCQGVHFGQSRAEFRRLHPTLRPRTVQVEPNRSLSAVAADEWIPIKPGTYDALALGIAHELVEENHYDKEFVARHTSGFDRFRKVLEQFPPKTVSRLTDVPEIMIHRLTRELATSRPSVVVADTRSVSTSNGLAIARSVLALNALLGNIERPGGVVSGKEAPLTPWPEAVLDETAAAGLKQPALDSRVQARKLHGYSSLEAFPEAVLSGDPYAPEALLLYYSNPLFARNSPERFSRALKKIPFIATFSPFMDESAQHADLILPDHTFLERWEDAQPPPFGFQAAMGLRRPVVEPLYDTRHSGDAVIRIAQELGGLPARAFPWKDFKSSMEERLGGIAESGRGTVKGENRQDFLKQLARTGYWHDDPAAPEDWKRAFQTPSGKFEFHSQAGEADVPYSESPRFAGKEGDFPFIFMPYKDITYAEGGGSNIPYLQQASGLQHGLRATESWHSWVSIHPNDAAGLGIGQGRKVWVESPIGRIRAMAALTSNASPGMVLMKLGMGHTGYGRFAKGHGANPKSLLPAEPDPLSGFTPLVNTRVRITKA